ncbi:DNA polymerase III subunit gamma/tau [Alkalibacter mobilis]|uniref:DNA polymerase III subunit gamma/tau n=1 Tax=Alkalibacter mobilis TaxID=2787712 RepID=UPI00189D6D4F|nr:DNA polymerase III subunit gamma/tau [Alkalibacter mobilis]MBF7097200.1 DNA polymerase III subunit gamma/tau [Alkalibacter mobilis]
MDYIALYRKYRPKTFSDMIGQGNVVSILKNQIIMNKIAHAYLFSGTRGTGKTSAAKIFARGVNCPESVDGEPCNNCKTCLELESNSVMDIIEIDAASNRGVDEIRDLRDKVKYMPAVGKYKVYIIDEVHMLTAEAFNALLKTLEEPPPHAIFILATTEPNKLPATILSRCQRFNFKRLTADEIKSRMTYVANDVGIQIEEEALELIAKNADGAMRDALSILDQCIAISSDSLIEYEEVKATLGITDNEIVYSMIEAVLNKDATRALENLESAYNAGKEMTQLIHQLIAGFRDVLIYGITDDSNLMMELKDQSLNLFKDIKSLDLDLIGRIIEILADRENKLKYTSLPKILMEVTLIRLCTLENSGNRELERDRSINSRSDFSKDNNKRTNIGHNINENRKPYATDKPVAKNKGVTGNPDNIESNPSSSKKLSKEEYQSFLKHISKEKKIAGMSLSVGKPSITDAVITISFAESEDFHYTNVLNESDYLQAEARKIFGNDVKIKFVLSASDDYLVKELPIDLFGEDKVEFK